jgi:hypothetical protein
MPTIITITAEPTDISGQAYDYSGTDRILRNIMSGDYEIFYSGQNKGVMDFQLISSVEDHLEFKIYYRRHSNQPFIYLGSNIHSSIIHERIIQKGMSANPDERLQIRLFIHKNDVINQIIDTTFTGSGKYKKAILQHSQFNIHQNLIIGFYKC